MKLNELFEVINDTQYFDVYYKDNHDDLVKCASYNDKDSIDEKLNEAEVLNISITKYNTFDILIERVIEVKKYSVHFEVPNWDIELEHDEEVVFEDGESDCEIEERLNDMFDEWFEELKYNMEMYVEKEWELIED